MTRSIRVAALQLQAHDRSQFARSLDSIVDAVAQASMSAQLVVLPEGTFPAYVLGGADVDDSPIVRALDRLAEIARRSNTVIVAGAALRRGSSLRNAAVVIDADGSVAGRADKLFLWHFDRLWFEAGDRVAPIDTALGKLGALVCADGRLPTLARGLVERGAEIFVMPTAWVTSGRDPGSLENVQADLLARVRAYENGVPFVAANKCGSELGMVAYCGKSQIIDAAGDVVAFAGERRSQTLEAVVTVGGAPAHRFAVGPVESRPAIGSKAFRIAISAEPLPPDVERRLEILGDDYAIAPDALDRIAALDRDVATAVFSDEAMRDPAVPAAYRRAGYALCVWIVEVPSAWTERLARARALELRMYVIVLDRPSGRAFAVDPDGAVIAGTFGGYQLASVLVDPLKSADTLLAPGTDVSTGLERIEAIVDLQNASCS